MKKKNYVQKEISGFSQKNIIVKSTTVFYPTPKKIKLLVKPDFSPITNSENLFGLKTNGSYKKRAIMEPESPIKTPNTNYFTPIKIEGKDLFGTKNDKKFCRKLKFDDVENKEYNINDKITESEMDSFLNKFNINDFDNCNNSPFNEQNNDIKLKICNNRMENDFKILKTIKNLKFDAVYIVKEKKTKKIYCIKKNSKKSKKNNFETIYRIFNEMKNDDSNDNNLGEKYCMKYIDYWLENENYDLIKEDTNYIYKNIYILLEYYPFGDILDYLGLLERNNYNLTPEFYWDIFFEMIVGLLFFHNKGYIHFDIKPTNFIVDNDGYIKLNDFGLSHKFEELSLIDDIIEGDSRYISKELFDNNDKISNSNIDNRCDVFSLGLSFLEIIAKIDLPSNGKLWKEIRNKDFILQNEFLTKLINKNNEEFFKLINQMISPINNRPTLKELIKDYPEFNKRYEMLKINKYEKSFQILKLEHSKLIGKINYLDIPSINNNNE